MASTFRLILPDSIECLNLNLDAVATSSIVKFLYYYHRAIFLNGKTPHCHTKTLYSDKGFHLLLVS